MHLVYRRFRILVSYYMMMNLKRNGCLESIKGIIVVIWSARQWYSLGENALEIIEDVTKHTKFLLSIISVSATIDKRFRSVVHLEVTAKKKCFTIWLKRWLNTMN
jgi:muramoyltetrapeptide carboxypeptidase